MRILICAAIFFSSVSQADCKFQEHYELGRSYFEKSQYLLSAFHFSTSQKTNCPDLGLKSKYNLALSFFKLQELREVDALTLELKTTSLAKPATFLRKLAINDPAPVDSQIQNKVEVYRSLSDAKLAQRLIQESVFIPVEQKQQLASELERVPRKAPTWTAFFNAVLPGSGYAYLGMWQTAAYSFLLNSLFLASAIEFGRKDLHAPQWAAYGIFSITYLGGIVGGYRAAGDFNQEQMRPLRDGLTRDIFSEFELR